MTSYKKISLLLIILLILEIGIPFLSIGVLGNNSLYEGNVRGGNGYPAYSTVINQYNLDPDTYQELKDGRYFNVEYFIDRQIIVYGDFRNVPNNQFKEVPNGYFSLNGKRGEYRYYGYTEHGSYFSNPRFPNDGSGTDPQNRNWIAEPWRIETIRNSFGVSVDYANVFDKLTNYSSQYYDSIKHFRSDEGITIDQALSRVTGTKFSYCVMLDMPSLTTPGNCRLFHQDSGGKYWYQTFTGVLSKKEYPPMIASISPAQTEYRIEGNQDKVVIPVTVSGVLRDGQYYDDPILKNVFYTRDDVQSMNIALRTNFPNLKGYENKGRDWSVVSDGIIVQHTFNLTVYRSDLKVGSNTLQLEGNPRASFKNNVSQDTAKATVDIKINVAPPGSDPMITGKASTDPSEVQFKNQDIPVKLKVEGQLLNVPLNNVKQYIVYARKAEETQALSQTITTKTLDPSAIFDFVIPKDKIGDKDEYAQRIVARIYADLTNGKRLDSGELHAATIVYKNPPPKPEPEPSPYKPPIALFTNPSPVKMGDDVLIFSNSYDENPEGYITEYHWSPVGANINEPESLKESIAKVWYPKAGVYYVGHGVNNNYNLGAYTSDNIVVVPPTVDARITVTGTLKENRKFTISSTNSHSPTRYPIDWDKSYWKIEGLEGADAADLRYQGDLADNPTVIDMISKKPGQYKITLHLENTAGYTDTAERIITIEHDEQPKADFVTGTKIFRDPELHNNRALIKAIDLSSSLDGDYIKQRIWKYAYDSNNDGSFLDEEWHVIDDTNLEEIEFLVDHVGKYLIELEVVEGFGQPTIPEFITEDDYKRGNTSEKDYLDKVIEVDNLPPVVDFSMRDKKKVDIVIDLGESGIKENPFQLQNLINEYLKPELEAYNTDYQIHIQDYTAKKRGLFEDTHVSILASGNNLYVVRDDGTIAARGSNYRGQLGNNSTISFSSEPVFVRKRVQIPTEGWGYRYEYEPVDNIKEVYTTYGGNAATASTFDGGSYRWGAMYAAEGANYDGLPPFESITKYALGSNSGGGGKTIRTFMHEVSLSSDGTARTSGYSNFGQIGNGSDSYDRYMSYNFPTEAKNIGALDFSGYQGATVIIDKYGSVHFTGVFENSGRATNSFRRLSGCSSALEISLSRNHGVVLLEDGTVCGFGHNTDNQFGDNPTSLTSLSKIVGLENIKKALAGVNLTYALRDDGKVMMVGLGYDAFEVRGLENIRDIAVAGNSLYMITEDGDVLYNPYRITPNTNVGSILEPVPGGETGEEFLSGFALKTIDFQNDLKRAEARWRNESSRFFITIHDDPIHQAKHNQEFMKIIENTFEKNVHTLAIGNEKNQDDHAKIISTNNDKGEFFSNGDLNRAFQGIRDYIIRIVEEETNADHYILLGEEMIYDQYYEDKEFDPMFDERWRFTHDPYYFENSLGIISKSGEYRSEPIRVFDKVGAYTITLQAQDNPKNDDRFDEYRRWSLESSSTLTLYVHRRPIAQFSPRLSYNELNKTFAVTVIDRSYDLDHISKPTKGIVDIRYKWKKTEELAWRNGLPTALQEGDEVFIQQEVKDLEGAWSYPAIEFVTTKDLRPIAGFSVEPRRVYRNETFNITSEAYHPGGLPLAHRYYFKRPGQTEELYKITPDWSDQSNVLGVHTIRQVVEDSNGYTAEYTDTVNVVNRPPTMTITTPDSSSSEPTIFDHQRPMINWTYQDADGDPQRQFRLWIKRADNQSTIIAPAQSTANKEWQLDRDLTEEVLYYIEGQVYDGYSWSSVSERKYFMIITNRPPVADFDIIPSIIYEGDTVQIIDKASDPDGDSLSYNYVWKRPDGTTASFTIPNPSFRVLQLGTHIITQTVTDPHGANDSITKVFNVEELEITGQVYHTDQWHEIHQKQGNRSNQFYSGERFMLKADVTDHPIDHVEVHFEGQQVNNPILYLNTSLSRTAKNSVWTGNLYDEKMSEVRTRLKDGWVTFIFVVQYSNGIVKTDTVAVEIIGSAYDVLNYHRSN